MHEIYEGFHIDIGVNRSENIRILQNSRGKDIWIHLTEFPSPHAIIKNEGSIIPLKVIKYACGLVKRQSKRNQKVRFDIAYRKDIEHVGHAFVKVNHIIKEIRM